MFPLTARSWFRWMVPPPAQGLPIPLPFPWSDPRHARLAGALLWLPVAGVALGDRTVGVRWLHFSDVALALFLAMTAPVLWRAGRDVWPAWTRTVPLLIAVGAVSGLAPLLLGDATFDPIRFLRSFARLCFCTGCGAALAAWLRFTGGPAARHVVGRAFAISGIIGLGIYFAVQVGAPLPYSLVCGQDRVTCSAYYSEVGWFGEGDGKGLSSREVLRAQGLSSEPSRFGFLHAMALGFLLFRRPSGERPGWREAIVGLSALMSFALTAYALLGFLALVYLYRLVAGTELLPWRRAAAGGALLALLVTVPPIGPALRRSVGARLARIANGEKDYSAILRVSGSWKMAVRVAEGHPWTGAGLGQFDIKVHALAVRGEVWAGHLLHGGVQPWNVLAYLLGATGLLGVAAFAVLSISALRFQPELGLVFLVGLFADGTVLGPALWVFLALFSHPPEGGVA